MKKLMPGKGSRKPGDRHSLEIRPHWELGRIPTGKAKQVDGTMESSRIAWATKEDAQ